MMFYDDLPSELYPKLHQLSLQEAWEQGFINEIGDDEGNFLIEYENEPGIYYAVFDGYKVQCSEKLIEEYYPELIEEKMNDLSFFTYVMYGQEHIRLARPRYLDLGEPLI